jgi:photosystem II stability/assembly factor-like uncharacterized protein
MHLRHRDAPFALCLILAFTWSHARPAHAVIQESAYQALRWRLLGPFRGGWATTAAGVPGEPATFYFGAADGGVWKTTDAGVTWRPLFDRQGSASIGALALAPSDPNTIWVGTGQVHQRWDITAGDGIYLSTDGGKSWTHVGLAETRHIGAIWADPRDARVAVVAAVGHIFGPNPERGLYRTEDGGQTWSHVLDRGKDVGAVDIAADPGVPDVIYASTWQVRRHPWMDYFQPTTGPGSGIYKSTDGGRTWSAVAGTGLPTVPKGRIELAVAPGMSARRVWAAIDVKDVGGVYRSDDGGGSWTRVATDSRLASAYTSGLTPDPRDPDVLWAVGRSLRRSADGGKTFTFVKGAPGGDDYHFLWIDPRDPKRMIAAADQGATLTLNGGESWSSWYNQPTGQFYRLATDDRFPYWIYSGQQDSGTVALLSRSDYGQLTFRDWHPVGGDERDGDIPDPANPEIVYGAGLGGRLSKWNGRTGQVQNVSPWPVTSYGERPTTGRNRYSWITAIAIGKRPPHQLYQGSQMLYRSTDAGHSWQSMSPDLTGAVPGTKGCEGEVAVDKASACGFGVIFAITPSPAADGVVWAGSDNGRVQLTRDGGKTWANVTPPGLADWSKVNIIDASETDPATAYVAADRHRLDDFEPVAFRTHDYGATWTEIGKGLPRGAWVGVVRQDPKHKGLLFAGTSTGVHVSFDDGDHWQSLQLDLPRTGINDLMVKGDDLIAATQGRGIWTLDAIEPLRHLAEATLGDPVLLPPAAAVRLRANQNKDTPMPPEEPRGANPPTGAVLDYVLPDEGGPVTLEIADSQGHVIRRFSSEEEPWRSAAEVYFSELWLPSPSRPTARAGHNRFIWNLRGPAPRALKPEYSIGAVANEPTPALPEGALVLPGQYEVRLTAGGKTVKQPLTVSPDARVEVATGDLQALASLQAEVAAALSASADLAEAKRSAEDHLKAAFNDPKGRLAQSEVRQLLRDLGRLVTPEEEDPDKVNEVLTSLATDLEGVDAAPTDPQREVLRQYREGLSRFEGRWKKLAPSLGRLRERLSGLGVAAPEPR